MCIAGYDSMEGKAMASEVTTAFRGLLGGMIVTHLPGESGRVSWLVDSCTKENSWLRRYITGEMSKSCCYINSCGDKDSITLILPMNKDCVAVTRTVLH